MSKSPVPVLDWNTPPRHLATRLTSDLTVAGHAVVHPVAAVRSLTTQPRSASVLVLVLIVTAALALARVHYSVEAFSEAAGHVPAGRLLHLSRLLAVVIAPAGEGLKLAAVAYVFWAGLVFIRDVDYRSVFSAVVHAELPLLLGGIIQTGWLAARPGTPTVADLQLAFGLNLAFPNVPLTSPLGIILTRVNPFMLWWGAFLFLWVRASARIPAHAAVAFVLVYWVLFTGVLVSAAQLAGQ